jgi:hypothetical protein
MKTFFSSNMANGVSKNQSFHTDFKNVNLILVKCSVADPDQGIGVFLTAGSGMDKKSGSGSEMNNQVWVKILKFFDADPGSEMETIRIRDGKKSDPGWKKVRNGINIPDPQHW